MALKLILSYDEYIRLLRKVVDTGVKFFEILERKDIHWEFLEKIYFKVENDHQRYYNLLSSSVRQSELLK